MKYGALEETRVTIPGDERSRTNPGHGYPEHTETYTTLHEFDTEDELKKWIYKRAKFDRHFVSRLRVIRFENLQITEKIDFELNP